MPFPKNTNVPAAGANPGTGAHIDLGLALLSCLLLPGERLTTEDMAVWCGCSRSAIERIEQRALRKLRQKLVNVGMAEEVESILATFSAALIQSVQHHAPPRF